jgi:superoxide dismutase, Fe-Mn family
MEIHHGKHHATYTNNLNAASRRTRPAATGRSRSCCAASTPCPSDIRTASATTAAGTPTTTSSGRSCRRAGGGAPTGEWRRDRGQPSAASTPSRSAFADAATKRFGSGWAWLVVDATASLQVYLDPNQDNPLMDGHTPILGLDVWEHAYYLNYQNRRPDYIKAFWNVVDWGHPPRAAKTRGGAQPSPSSPVPKKKISAHMRLQNALPCRRTLQARQ